MNAESEPPAPEVEPRLADLEDALIDGLSDHLPGLEIVDRAFVLSGSAEGRALRADLVAIDACDRLVLILLVDGRNDETVFAGLESLTLLRAGRPLLAQFLRAPRISTEAPAILVLVAETFSERVVRTLAAVRPSELRLFEMRELSSAKGVASAFVAVDLARVAGDRQVASTGTTGELALGEAARTSPARDEFVQRLPAAVRPAAERCLARIDRVDSDLRCRVGFDSLAWRYEQRILCSLTWTGEHLVGVVGSRDAALRMRHVADVDPFVDRVLGEHLRRLAHEEDEPTERAESRPPLSESSAVDFSSGVLLSAEEIAAFRD